MLDLYANNEGLKNLLIQWGAQLISIDLGNKTQKAIKDSKGWL